MDTNTSNLGGRIAKGVGWTVLMRFSVRAIGIVSTIILARLLVPGDFGLIALATMFIAVFEVASEFNFTVYLIREQNVSRGHFDTVWTLSVMRGGAIAILVVCAAPYAVAFFNEPRLENVLYALAISALIDGCANVGIVEFRKSLNFHKDFQILFRTRVFSFVVTLLAAVVLRNYWALIIGIFGARIGHFCLSYLMHPFRPKPRLVETAHIMRFSKWLLANSVLHFANNRSDFFVIGKVLDSATLGIYSVAQEISLLIGTELVAPINRALMPGLAKLSHDVEAMRRAFIDIQSVIILVALPLAAGIGLTADPLVRVALGDQWLAAIPLIQVLVIVGIARVCRASSSPFILASGKPHLTTVISSAGASSGILFLLMATPIWGAIGAAWAVSASAILQLLMNFYLLGRAFAIPYGEIFSAIWRTLVACMIMSGTVWELLRVWPYPDAFHWNLLELLCAAAVGAVVYILTNLTLWRLSGMPNGPERRVLSFVSRTRIGRTAATP